MVSKIKSGQLPFHNDRFKKTRGGHSRWLLLRCEQCGHDFATYQKDGSGILKRLYLDRMLNGKIAAEKLICQNCKTVLGVKIVYAKENRPAYRLFAGAVGKKIVKGDKINRT